MTSTLRNLLNRFYPPNESHRVLIGGLDYTGKTTLLYLLKLNEIVTTVPSIGWNVESVDIPLSSSSSTSSSSSFTSKKPKTLSLDMWDVGSGCGGTPYMIRLLKWYMPGAEALIWMVDSTNIRRDETIKEGLEVVIAEWDAHPDLGDRHLPILILANKTDLPTASPLDDIRILFSTALKDRLFAVFPTSLTSPSTGLALALALDIARTTKKSSGVPPAPAVTASVADVIPHPSNISNPSSISMPVNPRDPSLLQAKLGEWLRRTEADAPPEVFIQQFDAYDLPVWDHYTHIRLAYLLLAYHGRREGKTRLFTGIQAYISHNTAGQTNTRGFHFTMTYFWIQIVHFGIRNLPPSLAPVSLGGTASSSSPSLPSSSSSSSLPSPHTPPTTQTTPPPSYPPSQTFIHLILLNPHLTDSSLWADYYTKDVIMSERARGEMVLPDKKALPSVVLRDVVGSRGGK